MSTVLYSVDTITRNGLPTTMAYGADSERISKTWNGNTLHFMGNDAELLVNSATPAGLLSSTLHPDVRREGNLTDFLIKDHLSTNRVTLRHDTSSPPPSYSLLKPTVPMASL